MSTKIARAAAVLGICISLLGCSRTPRQYVEEGNKQFEAGKLEDAELLYRKSIQQDPNFGEGYYRLALLALKRNQGVDAFQLLSRAVELQPANKDALEKLGDIALAVYMADTRRPQPMHDSVKKVAKLLLEQEPDGFAGNRFAAFLALIVSQPSEAVRLFRKADQAKPGQPELRLNMAQALIQAGEPDEGEAIVLGLLDSHPDYGPAYEMLYRRYMAAQKATAAEAVLQKRVEKNPSRGDYLVSLAAHYQQVGQGRQAGEVLARLTTDVQRYPDGLLTAGDYEVRRGDYGAALAYYAKGRERPGPHQITSRKRHAGTLVLAGRREEAAAELDKLAIELPGDRDVRASRAYLLLESGTGEGTKKAMEEMRALTAEKDDEAALHYHLGRGHLANGDAEGARKAWLRAVQLDAADVRPRIALARLSLNTGDPASALRQADELLPVYVRHPEIELIRASALIATRSFNEARTALEGLRKRYPGNPAVEIESAFLSLAEGAYNEAERGFRRIYRPGGADTRPMLGLAQTLVLAGKRPDALRLLEDDLKAAPGRPAVQIALAEGYAASGEQAKAVALLESTIKAEPRAAPAYRMLAGIRASENRLDDAIVLLKSATAQNPGNADLLSFLGDVQHAAGRFDEAEKSLREALAADPGTRRARISMALVLAESGAKLDEALQHAQQALKAAPADLAARDAVAFVYLKQKRTADALQTLRALAQQTPKEALFRYHHGLALAQAGEAGQARAEFEAALALDPPPFLEKRIRAAQR